jgi:hypothetical protein
MSSIFNSVSQIPPIPTPSDDSELEWLLCLASAYQSVKLPSSPVITLKPGRAAERILILLGRSLRRSRKVS